MSNSNGFCFAIFPYLKTNRPVTIEKTVFRSTEDKAGLTETEANALDEIASMLFLQDDFRIKSASYARLQGLNLDARVNPALDYLQRLQSLIAYCYSSPDEIMGHPFLSFEYASLVIFTPAAVPIPLLRPDFHTEAVTPQPPTGGQVAVRGYQGLVNFRHLFWKVPGSRLYPPVPHLQLNISQNLASDVDAFIHQSSYVQFLFSLMLDESGAVSERVFTALKWFNAANTEDGSDDVAILNLSVALDIARLAP